MKFRLAGLIEDSIVDGPGIRLAVFAQGCPFACPGCHNAHTHDANGGEEADTDEVLAKFKENPLLSGITLTGGEPFLQAEAMIELARGARELNKHVMVYTGYLFEDLLKDEGARQLLELSDILVDGPFVQEQRSLNLRFRGSKNQRILDVPSSLREGRAVCLDW